MKKLKQFPPEMIMIVAFIAFIAIVLIFPILNLFFPPICMTLSLVSSIVSIALVLAFRAWVERRKARMIAREAGVDLAVAIDGEGDVNGRTVAAQNILIDGAVCWRASNGSVLIKKRTVINWLALIAFGLLGLVMMAGTIQGMVNEDSLNFQSLLSHLTTLVMAVLFMGGSIIVLVRVMRIPSIHVNVNSEMIEIGRDPSTCQIPFASVYQVTVTPSAMSRHSVLGINLVLDDGDVVTLGTVSGSRAGMTYRAYTIAQWITDATGAAGPEIVPH